MTKHASKVKKKKIERKDPLRNQLGALSTVPGQSKKIDGDSVNCCFKGEICRDYGLAGSSPIHLPGMPNSCLQLIGSDFFSPQSLSCVVVVFYRKPGSCQKYKRVHGDYKHILIQLADIKIHQPPESPRCVPIRPENVRESLRGGDLRH